MTRNRAQSGEVIVELQFTLLKFDLKETISDREAGPFESDFYRGAIRAVEHGIKTGAINLNAEAKLALEELEEQNLIMKVVEKVQANRQFNQITPQMLDAVTTFVIDEWWRGLVSLHQLPIRSWWTGVNVSSVLTAKRKGAWQRYLDARARGGISPGDTQR